MALRKLLRLGIALASIALIAKPFALRAQDDDSHHGRKYKTPPLSSRIQVTVLRDTSGKPIQDAHVIFHPIEGDRDRGALELKTNEDGKIVIDVIPIGDTVRLQVIAHGFQTYGQDYKIDKSEMSMEIRMKRPGGQYSIYKNSATEPAKPSNSSPSSGDKQSGNSNAPDEKPNSGQSQQQPK